MTKRESSALALQEKLEQAIGNVKKLTLRENDSLGKTKHYYTTFGGGCRQLFTVNGRVNEFPYSVSKASRCQQSGPHPHASLSARAKSQKPKAGVV